MDMKSMGTDATPQVETHPYAGEREAKSETFLETIFRDSQQINNELSILHDRIEKSLCKMGVFSPKDMTEGGGKDAQEPAGILEEIHLFQATSKRTLAIMREQAARLEKIA